MRLVFQLKPEFVQEIDLWELVSRNASNITWPVYVRVASPCAEANNNVTTHHEFGHTWKHASF